MVEERLFRFKQFALSQQGCAMRIGTDGVLLGAWAGGCNGRPLGKILDIGCGCGIVSLMLAQRHPGGSVWGLEIDPVAADTASTNAKCSPFADRVQIVCGNLHSLPDAVLRHRYDLIVSNPPFFSHALPSPDPIRAKARHQANGFDLDTLFYKASSLLTDDGMLSLVGPYDQRADLSTCAIRHGLEAVEILPVQTVEGKQPKRLLSTWTRRPKGFPSDTPCRESLPLVILSSDGSHSEGYLALTQAFHPWIED